VCSSFGYHHNSLFLNAMAGGLQSSWLAKNPSVLGNQEFGLEAK
jgi:hypothetical protein